jgi:hypothetical protein
VGSGLFLAGFGAPNQSAWLGQFDAQSTSMSPPPDWLAARANTGEERGSDEVVRTGSICDENVSGRRRGPGRAPAVLL